MIPAVLDNTLIITMPILLGVAYFTSRTVVEYFDERRGKAYRRWVWILAVVSAVFVPSMAAIVALLFGIVCGGLEFAMAGTAGRVDSAQPMMKKRRLKATLLVVASAIPLVVTLRVF